MADQKTPDKSEFPIALVHPDLKGRVIYATSPTSLRAHEASGWKRAPKNQQPDG